MTFLAIDLPGQIGCEGINCDACRETFGVDPCQDFLYTPEDQPGVLINAGQLPPGAVVIS